MLQVNDVHILILSEFFFEKGWGLPLCHPLPSSYAPVKGSVLDDEKLHVLGIQ